MPLCENGLRCTARFLSVDLASCGVRAAPAKCTHRSCADGSLLHTASSPSSYSSGVGRITTPSTEGSITLGPNSGVCLCLKLGPRWRRRFPTVVRVTIRPAGGNGVPARLSDLSVFRRSRHQRDTFIIAIPSYDTLSIAQATDDSRFPQAVPLPRACDRGSRQHSNLSGRASSLSASLL